MLSTTDLRGTDLSVTELRAALPRAEYDVEASGHVARLRETLGV